MTALEDLVEPLKRELALPGTFDTVFPDATDDELQASLADGFAEAQLYGYFPRVTLIDTNGTYTTDPDISLAGGSLIITFTAVRTLRAQLRTLTSMERYKAGPVEVETQRAASLLKGELDYLTARLKDLIDQSRLNSSARLAVVFDNYRARTAFSLTHLGGFFPYECDLVEPVWAYT